MVLRLDNSAAQVLVDAGSGGRVASLVVRGTELIVGPAGDDGVPRSGLDWGLYPMAPYAGRVRNAAFGFDGAVHRLPPRAAPNAIHGTVDDAEWDVHGRTASTVTLGCAPGPRWPFASRVTHTISLLPDRLRMELSVHAHERMPVQVGWHPWFARPASVVTRFTQWLPRDADGMPGPPTTEGLPGPGEPVDDCFVAPTGPVLVDVAGVRLSLTSDCSHWVVYDGAAHGVCVEPQSGPPNEIASAPRVVGPGQVLGRWFEIAWEQD